MREVAESFYSGVCPQGSRRDGVRGEGRAPWRWASAGASGGQEESAGGKSREKQKTLGAGAARRSRRGRKVREGAAGEKDVRV